MNERRRFLRRLLLLRIVQGFSITGLGFLTWPFVKAWIPSFEQDNSLEVSLADLEPGEFKTVNWLGRRVFIQRRSRTMVDYFDAASLDLKDPDSSDSRQPDFARTPWRSLSPEYFVAFNNCTHLGCEVTPGDGEGSGVEGIGFECPCHQSLYDYAGRVVEGAAAPTNLEIPKYSFVSRSVIRLEAEVA